MTWISLSLLSAVFLGLYDVTKKAAVKDNAVPPVLLVNVLTAALVWLPVVLVVRMAPDRVPPLFRVDPLGYSEHAYLFLKSALVGASWTCAFFALKHLPISIATTIRATSPMWTILIAVACLGERPSGQQYLGSATILVAFLAFSRVGKGEGIVFHRDRWVGLMLLATLLGASSALYDKFLLQTARLSPATVQCWFSIYLVPVMCPLWVRWLRLERGTKPFQWRVTIPLIALALLVADFLYFSAISCEGALISVISPLRRTSIVIPLAFGVIWLGETSWRHKLTCIAAILMGVHLLSRG